MLQGHFSAVTALSFGPDDWTLLSGGRDKVAILWDLHTNTKMTAIPTFEALEGELLSKRNLSMPITFTCRF